MMLGWATALFFAGELTAPYDGHALVKVEVASVDDLRTLEQMGLEVWTESPGPGIVHVRVPPHASAALAASGFAVELVTDDLGPIVAAENFRVTNDPVADHTDAFFDDFRELDEIYAHIDELVALRPDIAFPVDVGTTLDGRSIRGIEVRSPDPDAGVILIGAGQHAREWIAMATGICIADELVTRADEPAIDAWLSQLTFVIVPVINPDGYVYTFSDDRFWRKNRRDEIGVDTNRNWGVAWGGPGSSGDPEAQNYRGEEEFSENETAAMRDLAGAYPNLRSALDLHSFGQLVLYPWGFTEELAPADDVLSQVANDMAEALGELGTEYTPLMGTMLYPAAGNAPDWYYGELGAYAFTYELRPMEAEEHDLGFVLAPEQIRDVCVEVMAGIGVLADFTISAAPGTPGDDGNAETDGWDSTGVVTDTGDVTEGSGLDSEGGTAMPGTSTSAGTSGTPPTSTSPTASSTLGAGSSSDEGSDEGGGAMESNGCGCRSTMGGSAFAWLMLATALVRRRRVRD